MASKPVVMLIVRLLKLAFKELECKNSLFSCKNSNPNWIYSTPANPTAPGHNKRTRHGNITNRVNRGYYIYVVYILLDSGYR